MLVVGVDAEQVADRVTELRASGRRASGFVGDDLLVAETMAAELFAGEADVEQLQSRS
ncbi:MAG TPA: hypothetical protein VM938_05910 [Acidimicrobiales bacterium]|nr:hypothetical protein [Acidimicrobiales bacterium]